MNRRDGEKANADTATNKNCHLGQTKPQSSTLALTAVAANFQEQGREP